MNRRGILFGLTAAVTLLLAAASIYAWTREENGARAGSQPQDQVERGRALFLSAGCSGCHDMRAAGISSGFEVAPDLSSIARTGGERVAGQSAEEYIRTSIVAPDAYYAPGWSGTFRMPRLQLTPAELEAIVAFLLAGSEQSAASGVSS